MVSASFRLLECCYLRSKISEFQSGATYPFELHWLSSSSLSELMVTTLTGLGESAITMVCRVSPDLGTLLLLPPPIQSCCCWWWCPSFCVCGGVFSFTLFLTGERWLVASFWHLPENNTRVKRNKCIILHCNTDYEKLFSIATYEYEINHKALEVSYFCLLLCLLLPCDEEGWWLPCLVASMTCGAKPILQGCVVDVCKKLDVVSEEIGRRKTIFHHEKTKILV